MLDDTTMFSGHELGEAGTLLAMIGENSINAGLALNDIKTKKLFRLKGYESFKEFVEDNCNVASPKCNQMIRVARTYYERWINLIDTNEQYREIPYECLLAVEPFMSRASKWEEGKNILDAIVGISYPEVKMLVAKWKEMEKAGKTLDAEKEYEEKVYSFLMKTFDCSKKKAGYYMSLLVGSMNPDSIRSIVKTQKALVETMFNASVNDDTQEVESDENNQ